MNILPVNKLISFIIPTRHRKELILNCIKELIAQVPADKRKAVEIILKVDNDDPTALGMMAELPHKDMDFQVVMGYRGRGYKDAYIWGEECCRIARGTYFALFNDDAKFDTAEWFDIFVNRIKADKGIFSYWFSGTPVKVRDAKGNQTETEWPSFIFHHRKFWEIVGLISGQGTTDSFIANMLDPLGLLRKIPEIKINHTPWFQKPKDQWDDVTRSIAAPGQIVPTDMALVQACRQKIIDYVKNQQAKPPAQQPPTPPPVNQEEAGGIKAPKL